MNDAARMRAAELGRTVDRLAEENAALQRMILSMADRLEICSRLLGKCAERRTCKCERRLPK